MSVVERDRALGFGFLVSVIGHGVIAALFLFGFLVGGTDFGKPIVYSVTLEGGKQLGGIQQVPKQNDKSQMAPPKNVQALPEPAEKPSAKEKPVEEKVEKKVVEDAEVSTAEKKKEEKKPEPAKLEKKDSKKPSKEEENKAKEKPKVKDNTSAEIDKKLQQAMQRYLGESTDAGQKGFGAGAIGGKGMGGGTYMPEEALRYMKLVENRIKGGWRWYDKSDELLARVSFDLSISGEVSNIRVLRYSGNAEFDRSIERAIMKASPLPPPPASVYSQYFKTVMMTFDPKDL